MNTCSANPVNTTMHCQRLAEHLPSYSWPIGRISERTWAIMPTCPTRFLNVDFPRNISLPLEDLSPLDILYQMQMRISLLLGAKMPILPLYINWFMEFMVPLYRKCLKPVGLLQRFNLTGLLLCYFSALLTCPQIYHSTQV